MIAPLPIDDALPRLLDALRARRVAVLEAPPGAGKTTRAPSAVLDAGLAGGREVIVLEPRRLAARMAARRVAEERGEALGETVGYQVRFEEVSSARTRIRFVTEGVLTRRMLSDPTLSDVGAVLLDEFHERHLQGDVALALLRRLQRGARPDLHVVAMSATLDGAAVADFLGAPGNPAPRVVSEGRRFDVAIEHLTSADDRPLAVQVAAAVRRLVDEGLDGDVLVFLPGAAEIRRGLDALAPLARAADLLVLPLHGDLPPAEQDRAVLPAAKRKVILSTNVAETSVTIDGVVAVIDAGLARVASHAAWSGLPVLQVAKVSRASATQRAGRAGRTRPGRCLRLYTRHDHDLRPAYDLPEVRRLDLAETALELHAAGERDLAAFGWFEAPGAAALDAAESLLRALGAVDAAGAVTPRGRRMLRLPVHPRLSRMLVEAHDRGVGDRACALAALVSERDIVASRRGGGLTASSGGGAPQEEHDPDVFALLARFEAAQGQGFDAQTLRYAGLDVGATLAVERVRKQLVRGLAGDRAGGTGLSTGSPDEALGMAVLAGWPDRVARRVRPREYAFASGGSAWVAGRGVEAGPAFVVAVDAEERREGRQRGVMIRAACELDPAWLLDLFPDAVIEQRHAAWNADKERVDVELRLVYRGLVIDASRAPPGPETDQAAADKLAEVALARGVGAFVRDAAALEAWCGRVDFVARTVPEAKVSPPDAAAQEAALRALCVGCRSLDELRGQSLLDGLRGLLTGEQRRAVELHAPERVMLPGGRAVRIHYEPGKAPWMESRLQDFFGMPKGPSVAQGRVPVVLHLLAPNQRAVQVTTDLEGFWLRHYPSIRKELCRKYPRHPWPEDGRTATPPAPRPPRPRG